MAKYKAKIVQTRLDGRDTLIDFQVFIDGKCVQQPAQDDATEDRTFCLQIANCQCPKQSREALKKFMEDFKEKREFEAANKAPVVKDLEV